MKIYISEIDRQIAKSVALKNIARFFGISDWEFKSNDELQQELENIKSPNAKAIVRLLQKYFSAYNEWFNFYQEKKAIELEQGTEYELNSSEQSELQKLIDNRERALSELQNEFDRLQLQREAV